MMMVEYMMRKKDHKYLILVKILANPAAYIDVLQTEKAISMWHTAGLSGLSPIYVEGITLFIFLFIFIWGVSEIVLPTVLGASFAPVFEICSPGPLLCKISHFVDRILLHV